LLGDTWVQAINQVTGSGMDQQIGGLEAVSVYKTTGGVNDKVPVGTPIQNYTPTGELISTSQITSSGQTSFFGGLVEALKDPVVLAALAGGYGAGLFGGTGALGGAATVGTTGLTAAEIASLTATDLAIGAGTYAVPTAVGTAVAGLTAAEIAALTAQDLAIGGGPLAGTPPLTIPGLLTPPIVTVPPTGVPPTGVPPTNVPPTGVPPTGVPPAGVPPTSVPPTGVPPTGVPPIGVPPVGVPPVVSPTGIPPTISTIAKSLIPTAVSSLFSPKNTGNLSNLFSGGLGTAGSLLQMQQSREAALQAQARIDAETAAAKQAAAFRPVGMTTRFGTSQFQVDPVTGQLTSAGYTLSPEAKAAQDRLVALAGQGLTQAEQAQQQFAPLQTGAQRLFELGQGYLAKTPQDVAQNYLNQQMALLQPGRELELANLQNRLQQQGRGGLSVAQGGTLGATTPELQALYNARAQQEAQLAANAQQYGQQQVAFGAGLLGTGAQTMGQYYGGQQAAYSPYTTALGQVQNLESMAQQPLQMGATLGQQASAAGARMGELGLRGAGQSVALATGADATRNLAAQGLIAAGNPNAMFGQAIGGALGGLFNAPQSGFSYGQYGTGIDPSTGEYFGSLYF
jgi:hypothetical protein